MSEEMKEVNDIELEAVAGGKDRIADGVVAGPHIKSSSSKKTVTGLSSGWLALRSAPGYDASNEIGQLYNGDTVEVIGDTVTVHNDFHGTSTYIKVHSSKLHKDGYVNAAYIK
jgi:hypothetical protein